MTKIDDIKFYRGPEAGVPAAEEGEPLFTTDTHRLFVGSNFGNVEFARKDDLGTGISESYTASDGQTVFNTTHAFTAGAGQTKVFIDGVPQPLGTSYTEVGTNEIVLSEGVPAGAVVTIALFELTSDLGSQVSSNTAQIINKADKTALGDITTLTTQNKTNVVAAINENVSSLADIAKNLKKDFGAKGDGITDDTQAFINAFAWANSLMYSGFASNIKHAGALVEISDGVYNLATLTSPIMVNCNVRCGSAEVLVPSTYAKSVFTVGLTTTDGSVLTGANVEVPRVRMPVNNPIVSGSIGVTLSSLNTCKIYLNGVEYIETAVYLTGVNQGVTYCQVHLGQIATCKRGIAIIPGSGGWVNSNQFFSGSVTQSPSYSSVRSSGWRHILIDGSGTGATAVVGNAFFGLSLEGNLSEYIVEVKNGYGNTWYETYHETGASFVSTTLSGSSFTTTNHGLSVGDYLTFNASTTPTGMVLGVGYYVVAVPDSNTFQVSLAKGAITPITFSTNGSSVTYKRQARCNFDPAGGLCYNNTFKNTFTPSSILLDYIQNGQANGNGLNNSSLPESKSGYFAEDVPLYRGRNTSGTASSRAVFAAYGTGIDPITDPQNWSTAIGDRGLIWGNNRSEIGRLFNSSNTIQYMTPSDTKAYEIASCRRSPSLINVSNLSCVANATTFVDVTLNDCNTYEHVLVTPVQILPSGIVYSHAFVTSANTIRVVFYNFTASTITLSATLQAVSFRRFI